MTVHHIGYLVKHMEKALAAFLILGFKKIDPIDQIYYTDISRKVNIAFIKQGTTIIELVSPVDKTSPVYNTMKKIGNAPYHICYESSRYFQDIKMLQDNGYMILHESAEAVAIQNREVTFLFHPALGLIELLNAEQ